MNNALRGQLLYMPLLAMAIGLMLVRMLILARLLDVPGFAELSAGLLVSSTFCMLACLGLQPMLQRDLPVLLVHRRERSGSILVAQCLIIAAACAVFGIVMAAVGLEVAGLTPLLLFVAILHGLSQQLFLIATVESRSRGDSIRFARQSLERSMAVLLIGALSAVVTGMALWTLLAEALVSLLLGLGLLRLQVRVASLGGIASCWLAFRRLPRLRWHTALGLLSVSFVGFCLINADRWLAAELLPSTQFAQYAFAWMLLMIAQSVQVIINASFYPFLARRFASFGRHVAFRIAARASILLLICGALLSLPLWALLHFAVARWFPGYTGTDVLLPLFLAVATLRVSDYWSSFLMITGGEWHLLWLNIVVGVSVLVAWRWLLHPEVSLINGMDIALLAVLLAGASYVAVACAAWWVAKQREIT